MKKQRMTNVASPVRRDPSGRDKNEEETRDAQRRDTKQLVKLEQGNQSIMTEYIRINLLTLRFSSPQLESEFYKHRTNKMRLRVSVVSAGVVLFSIINSIANFTYIEYPAAQLAVSLKLITAAIATLLFLKPKLLTENFNVYSTTIISLVALLLISRHVRVPHDPPCP